MSFGGIAHKSLKRGFQLAHDWLLLLIGSEDKAFCHHDAVANAVGHVI